MDDCPGCMSDEIEPGECDPECLITVDHDHLRCLECGYEWTEG